MRDIKSAIKIMERIPAPHQIMIMGPSATLGKLFKIVKYGSATLEMNGNHHKIVAINKPKKVPSPKLIKVSYTVTQICWYKSPVLCRPIIVENICLGLEKMNVLITWKSAKHCQRIKKNSKINICVKRT